MVFGQANGNVSTTTVWQKDAMWATKAVTGLSTRTTHTFKVKACYSGTLSQETSLGAGTKGIP